MTTRRMPASRVSSSTEARSRRPISSVISPGTVTISRSPIRTAASGAAFAIPTVSVTILCPCSGSTEGCVLPSNGLWVTSNSGPRPSSEPVSCGSPNFA